MSDGITDMMNEEELNKQAEDQAFEIFAQLHPEEAYDQDSHKFCEFVRKAGFILTDAAIKTMIE